MKPMRDKTRKKREFVMETALSLFMRHGFENVSVDEIIAATNTSKGTFYHYFNSKDDILREVERKQLAAIDEWAKTPPSQVVSVEGHVNRLFLDLASNLAPYRKLASSYLKLTMLDAGNDAAGGGRMIRRLRTALLTWLPEPRKAELLTAVFVGTLLEWCNRDDADLIERIRTNLSLVWPGLRNGNELGHIVVSPAKEEEWSMKVAIIGGGLAGLTAAAYLSEETGVRGMLFERSPHLGGRAFTYEREGFTLNYGAHAIYGIDRHELMTMERELGLSFSFKEVDRRKVMYAKNGKLTVAPLDFVNIIQTGLLNPKQKIRFVSECAAIIANIHNVRHYKTLGEYLDRSHADEDVKELWEHLVCSNFFIAPEDARNVPGQIISDYYNNLFKSNRPVNYVLGSWAVITNQLRQKIEMSGRWDLFVQEGVDRIRYEDGQFVLTTKNREERFDQVVFAMPIQQAQKLLKQTPWEPFLRPYEHNTPTEVMVYDVGFNEVVARPFSYVSDMDHKMFISDVSATDHTIVPEGGQLLQGIAYLADRFDSNEDRKTYLDNKMKQMEQMFDRYYPGWREKIAVKRVSKKAMVASVKTIASNRPVPCRIENVPFYFCGDGCEGKGQLAERAFSSARQAAKMLLNDALVAAR